MSAVHAAPGEAGGTADELTIAADRLFQEARQLAKDNQPVVACERFKQSYALKRTFGTAVNLGDCARHDGQLALAWQRYHEAVLSAERDGAERLAQFARERADAVAPELCTVVVTISAPDVAGVTVRIADRDVAASSQPGQWAALVDPGQVDIEVDGVAGRARVVRRAPCPRAGEVTTVALYGEALPGAPLVQVAAALRGEPRRADASIGVGYVPEQDVGASLAFGSTVELSSWPRFAITGRLTGAVFRTRSFLQEQRSVRQTGVMAFLGPALRFAAASRLWLEAGAGVSAGFWLGGGSAQGAMRPGFELGAGYWISHVLNASIGGFGFFDRGGHLGSISVMTGARFH